jgi:hypothetical protein
MALVLLALAIMPLLRSTSQAPAELQNLPQEA